MPIVFVRVSKRLVASWVARHEKDGIDEWKLATFVRSQYQIGSYDRIETDLILFRLRFQKRGGVVMTATLWVRERKHNGMVELVIYKGHVEPLEGED